MALNISVNETLAYTWQSNSICKGGKDIMTAYNIRNTNDFHILWIEYCEHIFGSSISVILYYLTLSLFFKLGQRRNKLEKLGGIQF